MFININKILFAEEESRLSEYRKTLEALERLIIDASKALSDSDCSESQTVETYAARKLSNSTGSYNSPFLRKQIPDYYVDSSTKLMYLTPLGRKQVKVILLSIFLTKCSVCTVSDILIIF